MIGSPLIDLFSAPRKDSLLLLGREQKFPFGPLNGGLPVRSLDLSYILSLWADDVDAPGILFSQKSFLGRETGSVVPSGEQAMAIPAPLHRGYQYLDTTGATVLQLNR